MNRLETEKRGPVALVSLPHAPMTGFKRNRLEVTQGKLNTWDVEAKNDDGSAYDLTASVVHCTVHRKRQIRGDSLTYWEPILDLDSTGAYVNVTDPAAGAFTISLSKDQTAAIQPGLYFYDIWVESAGLKKALLDKAEFRVHE